MLIVIIVTTLLCFGFVAGAFLCDVLGFSSQVAKQIMKVILDQMRSSSDQPVTAYREYGSN